MDEQFAAFAGLFSACARALRNLKQPEHVGDNTLRLEVAAQLDVLAMQLEKHLEQKGRQS